MHGSEGEVGVVTLLSTLTNLAQLAVLLAKEIDMISIALMVTTIIPI
ncbi:hypothetical protein L2E81_00920 [Planktothrix agardhii 1033]|nr:hypothetical protein [Planktothrix agardhii 1033]